MKHAIYGASLDPITNGHLWVIASAIELFDHVTVVVADRSDKKYLFSAEERLSLAKNAIANLFPPMGVLDGRNTAVERIGDEFLADLAKDMGVMYLVRGVRSVADYEYERAMQQVNADIDPDISTVFVFPPSDLGKVSSSMVKDLVGRTGWERVVAKYVPDAVLKALKQKHDEKAAEHATVA